MNIKDIITESQHKCPHCGGPVVEYSELMEKKDACYYKVKASAKVWPSAYASGRLVQCRKKGAANYGNKSEGVAEGDYADGTSIKTPGSEDWKQQYQQAVMSVKNARTQQEYEAASDRAGRIKDLLASKGIQVGAVLGQQGVAEDTDNKCPPATQDIALNLKNRQKAIDDYGYGPLNPDMPNAKFWMKKVDEWNLDSVDEAKSSLCGNCAAFDIRQSTLDCIAQGIDSNSPADAAGVIDAGELGYCKFLKFKCASRRTCDAWVTGGPLRDKPNAEEGLTEEFDLIESIIESIAEHNGVDAETVWADLESLTEDELYAFAVTSQLNEDWQKANKRDRTAGMSQKAVNAYRRENPGSKLKTAVTTKPSKLKRGSKASKRRKSYCSRSRGQMKMHSISCAKTPDKAICKARRRWNC
jgi:hypothetical protein